MSGLLKHHYEHMEFSEGCINCVARKALEYSDINERQIRDFFGALDDEGIVFAKNAEEKGE